MLNSSIFQEVKTPRFISVIQGFLLKKDC